MTNHNECLRGLRRPTRGGAVWLTYVTHWRWLCFVTIVVLTFVSCGALIGRSTRSHVFADPRTPDPQPSANAFHGQPFEFDLIAWKELRSLWVNDIEHCQPLWMAGNIPNLESLFVMGPITDAQLAELCRLYDLQTLALYDVGQLSASGFSILQQQTQLTCLELHGFGSLLGKPHPLRDAETLGWPPNLKILKCDDTRGIPAARLQEWQQLKHLRYLTTRLIYRDESDLAAFIDPLRQFPSLFRLYLADVNNLGSARLKEIQRKLPRVWVRPRTYNHAIAQQLMFLIIIGHLLALAVWRKSELLFSHHGSLLIPAFGEAHFRVVGTVFALVAMVSIVAYRLAGCSLSSAVIFVSAAILIWAVETKLLRLANTFGNPYVRGLTIAIFIFQLIIVLGAGAALQFAELWPELEWLIEEHFSGWLVGLFVVGAIWGASSEIRSQIGTIRLLEERGRADAPLKLSNFDGLDGQMKRLSNPRKDVTSAMWWFDYRMDRFLQRLRSGNGVTSSQLWNHGSIGGITKQNQILLLPVMIGIFCGTQWITSWSNPVRGGQLVVATYMAMSFLLIQELSIIQDRISRQQLEYLRPIVRKDWIRLWFTWVARELAPLAMFVVLPCFFTPWLVTAFPVSFMDGCLLSVAVAGLLCTAFGVLMMAASLRSWIVQIGICVLFLIMIIAGIVSLGAAIDQGIDVRAFSFMIPVLLAIFGMAFVSVRFAWWCWERWEVGAES